MKHFKSQDWVDFARSSVSEEQRNAMQGHLDDGCEKCAKEFQVWKGFAEFAGREAAYEPPEGIVRIVKAALPSERPQESGSRITEVAQIVFDSLRQPQLAGVRSTHAAPRQLLYRAGAILIDMRLEAQSGSDKVSLIGQVLDSRESGKGLGEVLVHLLSGRNELALTRTNPLGEFRLECGSGRDLQISLEVSKRKDVFIPLDESIWRVPFAR
ncbi:MAG: hypothetical protein WBC04_12425 [Candidatus Acidiferrales bacterium]